MRRRVMPPASRFLWLLWWADHKPPFPRPAHWPDSPTSLDILNAHLVDDYLDVTGAAYTFKTIGAHYCPLLAQDLRSMWVRGWLRRWCCGISNMRGMGFPAWVWSYSMSDQGKAWYMSNRKERFTMTREALTPEALQTLSKGAQAQLPLVINAPKRERLVLLDHAPAADPVVVELEQPAPHSADEMKLTPLFSSLLDGPPVRPGVYRTMHEDGSSELLWQYWDGSDWHAPAVLAALALTQSLADAAPRLWQGLMRA